MSFSVSLPDLENACSVNSIEFQAILYYCRGEDLNKGLLTQNCMELLELVDHYRDAHGNMPSDFLIFKAVGQTLQGDLLPYSYIVNRLQADFLHREVKYLCDRTSHSVDEDPISALDTLLEKTTQLIETTSLNSSGDDVVKFSDYPKRVEELLKFAPDDPQKTSIFNQLCSWGFPTLDRYTQGICEGDVCVIFGMTNEGKSFLVKKLAQQIVTEQQQKILYLTFEETPDVAVHMIDSLYTEVPSTSYMNRTLDMVGRLKVQKAFNRLTEEQNKGEIIIPPITNFRRGDLREVSKLIRLYGATILVIDQLTFTAKSLAWEDMGEFVRNLKVLCRDQKIACLLVTQAKKDSRSVWEIGYEAVAHSEEIPRTADTVIYVPPSAESVEAGTKLLKLVKTRRGEKEIIITIQWDLSSSIIREVGEYDGDVPSNNSRRTRFRPRQLQSHPLNGQASTPQNPMPSPIQRPVFDWGSSR